jgi:hypothetical protein
VGRARRPSFTAQRAQGKEGKARGAASSQADAALSGDCRPPPDSNLVPPHASPPGDGTTTHTSKSNQSKWDTTRNYTSQPNWESYCTKSSTRTENESIQQVTIARESGDRMRGRERRTAGHGRERQPVGIEVREAAADSTACQMEKPSSAVTGRRRCASASRTPRRTRDFVEAGR